MSPSEPSLLLGPVLVGTLLTTVLSGVCANQASYYYRTQTRDSKWLRYFVLYLFLLELFNTVFDVFLTYQRLILEFDGSATPSLALPRMMLIGDPLIMSVISTSTRLFIAWRVKRGSSSTLMPVIIGFVTAVSLAGGISFAANLASASDPDNVLLQAINASKIFWLSSTALADIIVTVTLSLSWRTRQPGAKIHEDRLARFLRHSLHMGLVAAAVSSTDLIVALSLPHTTINFVWDVILSKIYVISLLSILNTRTMAQTGIVTEENVLFGNHEPRRLDYQSNGSTSSAHSHKRADIYELGRLENSIAITTVVEQMKDPESPPATNSKTPRMFI